MKEKGEIIFKLKIEVDNLLDKVGMVIKIMVLTNLNLIKSGDVILNTIKNM